METEEHISITTKKEEGSEELSPSRSPPLPTEFISRQQQQQPPPPPPHHPEFTLLSPLLPPHEPPRQQQQQQQQIQTGSHLAKAILGVAALAIPMVTRLLGVATTLIFLSIISVLTYFSLHFLTTASSRCGHVHYSDVVKEFAGITSQILLDISLLINSAAILIVAMVIIGDILVGRAGSDGLLSPECGGRQTILAVFSILLVAPLVSVTQLRTVAGASLLGVFSVFLWSIATIVLFLAAWSHGDVQSMHWWPHGSPFVGLGFESVIQTVAVLPIIIVAYTCQMALQHILHEIPEYRASQLDKVTGTVLTLCTVMYAVIGICSYGLFGKDVKPDILSNFTVDALKGIVTYKTAQAMFLAIRISFLVSLLAIFPLHMAPLRDSIWNLLFRQDLRGPGLWLITYLLLAGIYMAAAWLDSIFEPLLLIGSTAGVLIAFILPGITAIKTPDILTEPESAAMWRQIGGWVLIVVGTVIGFGGLMRFMVYRDPLTRM